MNVRNEFQTLRPRDWQLSKSNLSEKLFVAFYSTFPHFEGDISLADYRPPAEELT